MDGMRIIVVTQAENLYLPEAFARVCRAVGDRIVCIVVAPAMSTHGGPVRGFLRHFRLFGAVNTLRLGLRVIGARLVGRISRPGPEGPFRSLEGVGRAFGIPVEHVSRLAGEEFQALLDRYEPNLLISMSCPQVLGRKIRDRMPLGCINVHGAPLPRYRGLMPAFWALRHGERATAATVHDLEAKLDDGDILVQRQVPIEAGDTWDSLVRKTKRAGAEALVEAIEHIGAGTVQRRPNEEREATYFSFPTGEDRKAFLANGRRFL
jgi:methionyl-tRNA formyltransferase